MKRRFRGKSGGGGKWERPGRLEEGKGKSGGGWGAMKTGLGSDTVRDSTETRRHAETGTCEGVHCVS